MPRFEAGGSKRVIGMVHLTPLPGTPFHVEGSFDAIRKSAVEDACALDEGGADGCLVQTVDRVYAPDDTCDPARLVAMGLIVSAVVGATRPGFLVGVEIMRNALSASIAVAKVAGADFVRATALVGRTASPYGIVCSDPLAVATYRKAICADDIDIVADIRSQHFTWLDGEVPVSRIAAWASAAGATAVCLGDPNESTALALAEMVRTACPGLPIILAGYTNHANAGRLFAGTDGAFVGTCLERGGWGSAIDVEKVRAFVSAVHEESE
jgi:membrane complex biogenesis BtpA family protein